jgi:hypothetical protein
VWRGQGDVLVGGYVFGSTCFVGYGRSHERVFFVKRDSMVFLSTRHGGADFVSSHGGDKKIGRCVWSLFKGRRRLPALCF